MLRAFTLILLFCSSAFATATTWSETEFHLQQGKLNQPFASTPGTDLDTTIVTFQHASGWEYGGNFLFFDYARTDTGDELYTEWYPFFSSSALFNVKYDGAISDIGMVLGVNAAPDADVLKYLPGVQINWNVPGFAFFNTLFTAYIDDSKGMASGGAPAEENSYMIDAAWRYPVQTGQQRWSVEGHAEYISGRDSEIPGVTVKDWVLAQVQLRWDVGYALFDKKDTVFVGIEYQYWNNKLGTDEDESVAQLLGVWRL